MPLEKEFLKSKEKAITYLKKAKINDMVDKKISTILELINNSNEFFTSSSCAGRIVLLEIPKIGDKKNARFLGIWHRKIKSFELLSALKEAKTGLIWIIAQSPIIHVYAKTLDDADKLVKIANASGFKNSSFKSFNKNIVIEICSTERLDAPIGRDGVLFCNKSYLNLLVKGTPVIQSW
ncbi:MAG: tRNA-wybutosine modification methyltransferase TYW3 [Thermoplasmatota archaeon]